MTEKKTILVGVSGGIAGYKTTDLIKLFKKKGMDVRVIVTKTAAKMFEKDLFGKASGHTPKSELVPAGFNFRDVLKNEAVEHIRLADCASALVIAPATANIIGKITHGIADDLLSTVIMATTAPVFICPSMNIHMWENPIVQDNMQKLRQYGYIIIPPEKGRLACGYDGVGRLADINTIFDTVNGGINTRKRLNGIRILITAGGTSEPIDTVRSITNKGSGKMGIALASECHLQGAQVLLLRSRNAVSSPFGIKIEEFETVEDLESLMEKKVKHFDYIFHTAAVSDFTPEKKYTYKIDSSKNLTLNLKPTAKILEKIKQWNPDIKLIGFKAVYKLTETELLEKGREKLEKSHCDFMVVNDVGKEGIGFGAEDNEVDVLNKQGLMVHIPKNNKQAVARKLLEIIFP